MVILNIIGGCLAAYAIWKVGSWWRSLLVLALIFPIHVIFRISWKIGDFFLKQVQPPAYTSRGAEDAFKKRIFWAVGPQFTASSLAVLFAWFLGLKALAPTAAPASHKSSNTVAVAAQKVGTDKADTVRSAAKEPTWVAPASPPSSPALPVQATKSQGIGAEQPNVAQGEVTPPAARPVIVPPAEPEVVAAPSFDCEKASSIQEHLICNNSRLAALDNQMAVEFKRKMTESNDRDALRQAQLYWLSHDRRACKTNTCLAQAYEDRLAELRAPQN